MAPMMTGPPSRRTRKGTSRCNDRALFRVRAMGERAKLASHLWILSACDLSRATGRSSGGRSAIPRLAFSPSRGHHFSRDPGSMSQRESIQWARLPASTPPWPSSAGDSHFRSSPCLYLMRQAKGQNRNSAKAVALRRSIFRLSSAGRKTSGPVAGSFSGPSLLKPGPVSP